MTSAEAIKDRYPDPPPRPPAWAGWRRDREKGGPWAKIAEAPTRGACYQRLMELSELVGGEPRAWEFAILPAGDSPALASGGGRRLAY